MPIHVVAGHLVVVLAPMTAVIALVYAVAARSRRGMRWPLVIAAVTSAGLAVWAGEAGSGLLERVNAQGSAAERAAAALHAKGSDNLTLSIFVLLGLALAFVWRLLRPERPATVGSRVSAVLLAASAVAVLGTTWVTLAQALDAVWVQPT